MTGAHEVLEVRNASKRFGGTQALRDVSLHRVAGRDRRAARRERRRQVDADQVLAGVYPLDGGSISFRGGDVTASVRRLPIAFIHQDLGLIDWMTVAENICLTLGYPRRARHGRLDAPRASAPPRRSRCSAPTSIPTCASRA